MSRQLTAQEANALAASILASHYCQGTWLRGSRQECEEQRGRDHPVKLGVNIQHKTEKVGDHGQKRASREGA